MLSFQLNCLYLIYLSISLCNVIYTHKQCCLWLYVEDNNICVMAVGWKWRTNYIILFITIQLIFKHWQNRILPVKILSIQSYRNILAHESSFTLKKDNQINSNYHIHKRIQNLFQANSLRGKNKIPFYSWPWNFEMRHKYISITEDWFFLCSNVVCLLSH